MNFRTGDYGKYEAFIRDTERRFGLPDNLLAVTLYQASKFDPETIAGTRQHPTLGVRGIAALTPEHCAVLWRGADRRTDPHAAIAGAAELLKAQYGRFNNWRLALLAYHASPGTVLDCVHKHLPMPIDAARYVNEAGACCRV